MQACVDAIVVAYRSEDVIESCVNSILSDSLVEKVIVVNNDREQDYESLLCGHQNVEVLNSDRNLGYGPGINSARRITTAPYILIANPDTYCEKGTVANLVASLERRTRVGIVAPSMSNGDGTTCRNSQRFLTLPRMIGETLGLPAPFGVRLSARRHNKSHEAEFVLGAFFLARREALDAVNWFDSSIFLCGEDQDICRRIRAANWSVWYEAVGTVVHESGHSRKQLSAISRRALIEARERELLTNCGPMQARLYRVLKGMKTSCSVRMRRATRT